MLVQIIKPKQIKLKLVEMSETMNLIKKLKMFEKYIHIPETKQKLIYYLTRISKTDFECYYDKYKYFYDKYKNDKELTFYLEQKRKKIKEMICKFKTTQNNILLHEYILPNLVLLIEYSLTNDYIDEILEYLV